MFATLLAVTSLYAADLSAAPAAHGGAPVELVFLGTGGGSQGSNLTSLLVRGEGDQFLLVDGGSVLDGMRKADALGAFAVVGGLPKDPRARVGALVRDHLPEALITHPHLDHISGLVLLTTDVRHIAVHGLSSTLDELKADVFNWRLWPNFGDSGQKPALNVLSLVAVEPATVTALPKTGFHTTAFPLSHGGMTSTAFLIENTAGTGVLVLGDTGPDDVEKSDRLATLWRAVAPKVAAGALVGIVLEASYPNARPDGQLFGHLTPRHVGRELARLAEAVVALSPQPRAPRPLRGITLMVTHIKEGPADVPAWSGVVADELARDEALQALGAHVVPAQQGDRLVLTRTH